MIAHSFPINNNNNNKLLYPNDLLLRHRLEKRTCSNNPKGRDKELEQKKKSAEAV
jgi:hypothetical protein